MYTARGHWWGHPKINARENRERYVYWPKIKHTRRKRKKNNNIETNITIYWAICITIYTASRATSDMLAMRTKMKIRCNVWKVTDWLNYSLSNIRGGRTVCILAVYIFANVSCRCTLRIHTYICFASRCRWRRSERQRRFPCTKVVIAFVFFFLLYLQYRCVPMYIDR